MLPLHLWSLISFVVSINACPSAGGFDLSDLTGEMSYNWRNGVEGWMLTFAFCGLEENSCGTEPEDMCRDKPNCCGACQRWMDDDNSKHAKCLGLFKQVLVNPNGAISLLYTGGDWVPQPAGPRNLWINLTCDASATTPVVTSFTEPNPNGHVPGTPYWYAVTVATIAVCGCGPQWPTCTACTTQKKIPLRMVFRNQKMYSPKRNLQKLDSKFIRLSRLSSKHLWRMFISGFRKLWMVYQRGMCFFWINMSDWKNCWPKILSQMKILFFRWNLH